MKKVNLLIFICIIILTTGCSNVQTEPRESFSDGWIVVNDSIQVDEICYGIAIYVDDKSDFPGESSPLAISIGDSDNIDRFDVFRIYENLENKSLAELPYQEQIEYVIKVLKSLDKFKNMELATKAATDMWIDKITLQIQFKRD